MDWIEKNVAKAVGIAVALLLLLGLFAWHEWQVSHTAKTEVRLATGQAGAALDSGHDSANAIGNRMDQDAATDTITRENQDALRNVQGADAPVAPAATGAGIAGLCRYAAYRSKPQCLQHAHP